MAIEGFLNEIDLPTLIQLACQDRNQVRIHVRNDEEQAFLYFADGNVVHASYRGEESSANVEGEEVVFKILGWQGGKFIMETGVDSPDHTIQTPWNALLLEGLQRYDEQQTADKTGVPGKEDITMADDLKSLLMELGQQVPGYLGSSVVGLDGLGLVVDSVGDTADAADHEAGNAQMTELVRLVDSSVKKINAGTVEHGLLTTEQAYLVWRFLEGGQYFLTIAAERSTANVGNMYLVSRVFAEKASKLLPS
jgi:predicted regulator of Ras-like GTPase activity (Roadblock/LC7/MglB family)